MKNATNVPTENASVVHKAMRQAAVVRRFSGMLQNVPHTADGVNQGFAIVVVNFAAQSINVNVYHIGGRIKTHMPYMVEDHCPSNYTARVPAKVLQQSELLGGKLENTITPLCFAPNKIKLEIGNFQPQRFLL